MNDPQRLLESGCDSFALEALLAAREERAPDGVEGRSAAVVEAVLGLSEQPPPVDATPTSNDPRELTSEGGEEPTRAAAADHGEPRWLGWQRPGWRRLVWKRLWSSFLFAAQPALRSAASYTVGRRA